MLHSIKDKDAIFNDFARLSMHNTNYHNAWNQLRVSYDEDGTLLTNPENKNGYYLFNQTTTTQYPFNFPLTLTFDVIESSPNCTFNIVGEGISNYYYINNVGQYKIEMTSSRFSVYLNNTFKVYTNISVDNGISLRFTLPSENYLKFANITLKIL